MGGENTPSRAIVQSAGHAYVLRETALQEQLGRRTELKHLLLRYSHELMMQAARSAMCNRYHTLDQQMCRWLLSSVDRLSSGELETTEELIGDILSVDRKEVTEVTGRLHAAGLIRYRHGVITMLDRPQIEQRVCECYSLLKRETGRLRPYRESH
jgi:CRP-like cAMP-binding protein